MNEGKLTFKYVICRIFFICEVRPNHRRSGEVLALDLNMKDKKTYGNIYHKTRSCSALVFFGYLYIF